MAPSHATQWKRDTLPLPPPTPVHIISNLIHNLTLKNDGQPTFLTTISESSDQEPNASSDTASTRPTSAPETPLRATMERLASSDAWFLVSSSPVHSEEVLLHLNVTQISPTIPHYTDLTRLISSTMLKENLQIALCESQAHEQYWKSRTVDLQSGFVLQELYCKKVHHQLAQKEKGNGKGRSQWLNGDGMPCLLTSNDFYDRVIDHEETAICEEEEKKAHRDA
ncbi:hypothetical protein EDD85DRAFT_798903 [Armillaria nabsnona]|nr:hypothetical protein EDD85DRAFT_798903 [Armillaria nabsnona]